MNILSFYQKDIIQGMRVVLDQFVDFIFDGKNSSDQFVSALDVPCIWMTLFFLHLHWT